MQHQATALHSGGSVPQGHAAGAAGGVAQGRNVVNLMDSSDDDDALFAAMPLPADAHTQARGPQPVDSHMYGDGDEAASLQDACMPADDGIVWAPEDDMMDASFLSDDEAGGARIATVTPQPGRVDAGRSYSSQFGAENCNRAGNESSARIVQTVKDIVVEFAQAGSVQSLVRTALCTSQLEQLDSLEPMSSVCAGPSKIRK